MKIKDCPFCGSSGKLFTIEDHGQYGYYMGCYNDKCILHKGTDQVYSSKEGLIEMWNTRRMGLEDKVIDVVSSLCSRVEQLAQDYNRSIDDCDMYYYKMPVLAGRHLINEIEPEENE